MRYRLAESAPEFADREVKRQMDRYRSRRRGRTLEGPERRVTVRIVMGLSLVATGGIRPRTGEPAVTKRDKRRALLLRRPTSPPIEDAVRLHVDAG